MLDNHKPIILHRPSRIQSAVLISLGIIIGATIAALVLTQTGCTSFPRSVRAGLYYDTDPANPAQVPPVASPK